MSSVEEEKKLSRRDLSRSRGRCYNDAGLLPVAGAMRAYARAPGDCRGGPVVSSPGCPRPGMKPT